jgi:hypothetical protein
MRADGRPSAVQAMIKIVAAQDKKKFGRNRVG